MNLTGKSALIALGSLTRRFSTALVSIVLVRLLMKEDVGTYRQTLLVAMTLSTALVFGIPASVYYFVSALEKSRHRIFVTQTLLLLGAMALGGCLFAALGAHWLAARFRNADLAPTLAAIAPFVFFYTISSFIFPALISYQGYRVAVGMNVGFEVLRLVGVVAAVAAGAGLTAAFLLMGAISATEFVIGLALVMARAGGLGWPPTRVGLGEQLGYAVPLGSSTAIGVFREQIDRVVVSLFFSPEVFAVYSVGAVNLPLVSIIQGSVFPVMLTEMVKRLKQGEPGAAFALWRAAVRKMSLVLFPASVFSLVFASPLIVVLYTGAYAEAVIPFRIYVFVVLLRAPPVSPVLLAFRLSGLILWTTVLGLVVNLACSLALVQVVGFWGPPLAALISSAAILGVYYVRCGREMEVGTVRVLCLPEQARSLAASVAAGVGSAWVLWVPVGPAVILAAGFVLYCALYVMICWTTGLVSAREKAQLRALLGALRRA